MAGPSPERAARVMVDASDDLRLVPYLPAADLPALEALYEQYGGACLGLARHSVTREDAALAVVRDAFLDLWDQQIRFDPGAGGVAAWLFAAVHRRAVRVGRELGLQPTPVDVLVNGLCRAESPARGALSALFPLPALEREVLALCYLAGRTQREAASLLTLPLHLVRAATLRALRALAPAPDQVVRSSR